MCRERTFLLTLVVMLAMATTASATLPDGWTSQDIADQGLPGTADEAAGIWTVDGSGHDIWDDADDFHYCYMPIRGDIEISARVIGITGGAHEWAKAGLMIRETLDDNSNHAFMALTNNTSAAHAASFQWRSLADADDNKIDNIPLGYTFAEPLWVKIERVGDTMTGSVSIDGITWNELGSHTNVMAPDVYVGLAVTSHDNSQIATGTFDSVFLNGPLCCSCQRPWNPVPPNGSVIGREVWDYNSYLILDYTPCADALSHTAYFSQNEQDVIDRDPEHCLGNPPWPESSDTAFVVGYNDPHIPPYAREPLVLGTTYYWCVDESDDVETWFGNVWSFTPVSYEAWGPNPADGEQRIPSTGTMTWKLGDLDTTGLSLTYDLYIGSDETAVTNATTASPQYIANVTTENYDYAHLDGDIFWRVDTKLTLNRPPFTSTYTTGNVWTFTTPPPFCPACLSDLVAWWKLDGDIAPGTAFDSSGYGNHGTLMGDPTFLPGHTDNALDFNGQDYVYTGKTASDLGIDGNKPKSVSVWVKTRSFNEGAIWDLGAHADGENFCLKTLNIENEWIVQYWGDEYNAHFTYPSLNEWVHFGLVHDGISTVLYANGEVVVDVPRTLATSSDNPFQLGCHGWQDNYFDGMIDEVRIYKRVLSLAEIRILAGFLNASKPNPPDAATGVRTTPTLSWTPGVLAASLNGSVVYYSQDKNAVANRTAPGEAVTTTSYRLPTPLDLGETFYWAVDTANGIDTWSGDLWTFTTINWLSIDDMESYAPWIWNNIWLTWRDGSGNCQGSGNDTGADLVENTDTLLGGLQSMQYDYDNDGTVYSPCTLDQRSRPNLYSKIEVQVADLVSRIGSDWVLAGAKALSISFHGKTGNSTTDPLWVQLKDGTKGYGDKVFYGDYERETLDDFNEPTWHEWNIDLNDLNIDLKNVVSIVIGIGYEGSTTPGGSGTLYFDDFRLYTPRCVPARRSPGFAKVDFKQDCQIDYADLEILTEVWLETDFFDHANTQAEGTVNFNNYAEMLKNWLDTEEWPL